MKLEKKGDYFEKLVELPLSKEKIYYKVRSFTASQVESPPACYLQTKVKYQGCVRISSAMSNAAHAALVYSFPALSLRDPAVGVTPKASEAIADTPPNLLSSFTADLLFRHRACKEITSIYFLQSKTCSHSPIFEY